LQFYIVYDILRVAKKKRKIAQKGDCSHGDLFKELFNRCTAYRDSDE